MVAKIIKIAECSKYFHEIMRLLLTFFVFLAFLITYDTTVLVKCVIFNNSESTSLKGRLMAFSQIRRVLVNNHIFLYQN